MVFTGNRIYSVIRKELKLVIIKIRKRKVQNAALFDVLLRAEFLFFLREPIFRNKKNQKVENFIILEMMKKREREANRNEFLC